MIKHTRSKCFVLISVQRSGSTLLSEYLNSHPDIYMGRELFKMERHGRNYDEEGFVNVGGSVYDYLDTYYAHHLSTARSVGFKLTLDHLAHFPQIMPYMREKGIAYIYLERQNTLQLAISRLLARRRGIYHIEVPVDSPLETIDPKALKIELSAIEASKIQLRNLITPRRDLIVYYEELIENRADVIDDLLNFLEVDSDASLNSPLQKINRGDLHDVVANYDEITAALQGTRYISQLFNSQIYQYFNTCCNCLFIHVPKVAGSSVEQALFGTRGVVGHRRAVEYREMNPLRFEQVFSFAFVRNPYDRMVSAYFYLKRGGRNRFDAAWAEHHLSAYESFRSFVLALRDPKVRGPVLQWMHFQPQSAFVCDDSGHVIVDMIGKYETLESDFALIAKRLGKSVNLGHENASSHGDYCEYYDDESAAVVSELYAEDFDHFGYAANV